MSGLPWFKFYPSDWLQGTRELSIEETGLYISLVAQMYDRGGAIEEDHKTLARLFGGNSRSIKRLLNALVERGKIIRLNGKISQEKVEKVLSEREGLPKVSPNFAQTLPKVSPNINGCGPKNAIKPMSGAIHARVTRSQKPEARKNTAPNAREVHERCCELIGVSPQTHMSYVETGTVSSWLTGGATVEDIYQAIEARMRQRDGPPNTMKYFSGAVADFKATRLAPLPDGKPNRARRKPSPHNSLLEGFGRAAERGAVPSDSVTGENG